MTARIRLQFDEGHLLLDLPEMPRVGEGIVLPQQHDPAGTRAATVYPVTAVAQYAAPVGDLPNMPQRTDVRVRGTLTDGPPAEEPETPPGEIIKEELWRNITGNELSDYPHNVADKIMAALDAAGYAVVTTRNGR